MAAINVCARTGRVILSRTPSGKCLLNSQSTRHLLLAGRVVPSCLSLWPPALHQSSPSSPLLPVGVRYQTTTSTPSSAPDVPAGKDQEFRDRYIPMTRRTLIQHLLQEPIFLTDEEKKLFESFYLALDGAVINRHKGLLAELKSLFDPINPDKDTIESRQYNRRDRLDQEFWLLQKLSTIMEKANFHELPKAIVEQTLREHNVRGVLVSVHPEKYDVIRYWVVGKTRIRNQRDPWYRSILKRVEATVSPASTHYYKRVVVAVRLKKDDRLFLKAFREVPLNQLDQILPAGSVRMSKCDQGLLLVAAGFGLGGVLGKIVSSLLSVEANWTLALTGVSAAAAAGIWTSYKNRQQRHLVELSKTLYFKNIINNRGLLTLLVDKAEDEIFKEVLLTYAFLLTTRPPSAREKDSAKQTAEELGSMPSSILQQKVSDWINFKTGTPINFDPTEGIELLSDLGILTRDSEDNLHVLPLRPALRNLPQTGHTLTSRIEEYDLIEGFEVERGILEESEAEYTLADKLRKRFGWF